MLVNCGQVMVWPYTQYPQFNTPSLEISDILHGVIDKASTVVHRMWLLDHESMPLGSMMGGWVVFGRVISNIRFALFPFYLELSLSDSVSNPIVSHVHGFATALFNCVIGYASSSAVVSY